MLIREILIGLTVGFALQLMFDAVALAGQMIAMSMGLGFAVFIDRQRGVNMPVLGQLLLMLGMLIFLALDGHVAVIQVIADSFQLMPAAELSFGNLTMSGVLEWSSQLFVVAVKIALPAVTALVIANLSFGVTSRAAPTLNLFAVGFPVAMLLGFVVIFLNMGNLSGNFSQFLESTLTAIPSLLGGE